MTDRQHTWTAVTLLAVPMLVIAEPAVHWTTRDRLTLVLAAIFMYLICTGFGVFLALFVPQIKSRIRDEAGQRLRVIPLVLYSNGIGILCFIVLTLTGWVPFVLMMVSMFLHGRTM